MGIHSSTTIKQEHMNNRIIYIGTDIPDKAPAAIRVFSNAMALKAYGFDVVIISVDTVRTIEYEIIHDIEVWHLARPISIRDWAYKLIDASRYISIIDRIENVKAIIAYEQPAISYLRLRQYCHRRGIKIITETAEWQKWENLGNLSMIARVVRIIDITASMRYAYKKSDGLIVTSSFFKNHFKNCAPTLVIPTLQYQKLDVKNEIDSFCIRRFVYAGQLGYRKDLLSDIIRAFYTLRDHEFVFNILGLTYSEYVDRFPNEERYIKAINKDKEKIKFFGKVPHKDALYMVGNSDFALIIRESIRRNNVGFPTKFGESINCGTPVIVSDFSDVVYYTKKYNVGLVAGITTIEEGIKKAIEMDSKKLASMHKRCRECDAFYYTGHIQELGDFINSII